MWMDDCIVEPWRAEPWMDPVRARLCLLTGMTSCVIAHCASAGAQGRVVLRATGTADPPVGHGWSSSIGKSIDMGGEAHGCGAREVLGPVDHY
ncbi:hypothetical protein BP00DRAFT_49890 [Aspergillus indologenus CBS 114.80]|uniref:Uncharacterized protein n=1 Tax=Aspergillus indologenus CBS 114.80 TaxID=1450541 RepID=A0A2V5IDT7_9EURO|nr:hypothetical protein BP00DRAFT_49890 [Aspergillus indologenus CBS 114.80]